MHVTNDYMLLSQRFAAVRRAWKRNAALAGLAIVVTEGIGLFTVLLFLDWLYQPQPMVRLAFSALALAGLGWLIARHVVKPLLRKIPDEQIALYIEEHRAGLEGVLITAAEFGKKRDSASGRQAALIDAVLAQASQRSAKMQVTGIADFSRLKKYGIGALAGIGIYILLGVLFPATFGHHFGRILAPWHATDEDLERHAAATAAAEPLRFTVSKGDTSLARGSAFDFEVTLSKAKPADKPVMLNFQPKSGGDWQQLPMTEIEKLNGFQGTLPDVSEDLNFYVSCGTDKSDTYHLTVYDPLIVQSLETTVHYPDYLKLADDLQRPSTGDVTAVVGSTVTLRVLTTSTLKDGQIKWSDGKTQPMTVDPKAPATATFSFPVQADGAYDFTVTDVNGQQAVSPASLTVHAVQDTPPTISVKAPQSPILTNPVGEINFDVEAGDDFGVAGIDLVYSRLDAQGKAQETRVPLKYTPTAAKDTTNAVEAEYRLALEDINPPLQYNEAISYHLEARDGKGQKALSPLGFIIINYFETWGTWGAPEEAEGGVHDHTAADLMAMVAMIWDVNNSKGQTNPDDWKKQVDKVASKMIDGSGQVVDFVNLSEQPQLAKVAPLIADHAKKAHDALLAYDTATATTEISTAAAIFAGNGILLNSEIKLDNSQESVVGTRYEPPAMTMLEQARLSALADANKDKSKQEGDSADAAAADAAAKKVADLLKKQDDLVAKAQAQVSAGAKSGDAAKSGGNATGAAAGSANGKPNAPNQMPSQAGAGKAGDLAAQQKDLADQTRKAADAAKAAANGNAKVQDAADKAAAAAKLMEEAARAFATGNAAAGQDKAQQARGALSDAGKALETMDRDKLEAAISAAQGHASLLVDKLKDLNGQTQSLAKDMAGKAPDQRQQRDLQKQAYEQTQLGAQAEALNGEIADLNQRAQANGQPEAMRALNEAQRAVRRGQPQAKLAGAAVDLNNGNPASADTEQKSAIDALQKITDNLNAGSDALAASRDAQLRRAGRVAAQAKADLDALQGKTGGADQKGGADAQGAKDGKGAMAQAGGDSKGGDQAGQKPGEQAKNGGKAPGQTPGEKGQTAGNTPGTQAGQTPGEKGQAASNTPGEQGNGGGDPDQVRRLANNLLQLAAVTDNRQLVPQDKVDQLKEMGMDKDALEKKLETDPKFLADMAQLVSDINDKIEAELASKAQAGKLFSSQREECPPGYRQFVNQYFEALSHVAPAAGPAPALAPQP